MLLSAGGFLTLLGFSFVFSVKLLALERHPLVILMEDVSRPRLAARRVASGEVLPEPEDRTSIDADLAGAAAALRQKYSKPNVILVVLESVGALQLFDQAGKPSPEVTPHLAELARNGLLFDTVYSVYPATLRNHIALEMGGAYPTSEASWIDAVCRYRGATLPRHFGTHGYRTGFFTTGCLEADPMHRMAQSMGYEKIYHFGREIERANPRKIHGWGSLESCTLECIEDWIDEGRDGTAPFFLTYWTNATHHPYGAPPDYAAPFAGDDLVTRYHNSLHYTDAMLQRLVEYLRRNDLWDNTIIALTGDHGEAFGNIHPSNCMHSAHLYEENVRTFLLFLNTGKSDGPIVSSRPSSSGDILPTLADVAGLAVPEVPGQSLCTREMPPRFIFFFTFTNSERWGLRDGRWKFVQSIRDHRTELYDLSIDPTEQTNVAAQHPERVRGYTLRCQDWFQDANERFCAKAAAA
jgi:arylsulfatase A-like enzyme